MLQRRKPTLTPEEARKLHYVALVIDAQQPPATSGFLFTERMRAALNEYIKRDGAKARDKIAPLMEEMAVQEIKTSQKAREQYRIRKGKEGSSCYLSSSTNASRSNLLCRSKAWRGVRGSFIRLISCVRSRAKCSVWDSRRRLLRRYSGWSVLM